MEESPSPRGSPKSSEEIPIHLSRNRQRKLMMPPGVGQNPEEIKNLGIKKQLFEDSLFSF